MKEAMKEEAIKGPPVWLDMDQAELDAAYNQAVYAPNHAEVLQRYADRSEAVRARLGPPLRFTYGSGAAEGLDVYTTQQANAPIAVFIHGGAWRSGQARDYGFAAELLARAGAHFVVPDFNAVQEVGDSLLPMADQLRRAVAWVQRHAQRFGGDASRIHVLGHSSGAHLAAVVLTTDWAGEFGLPVDTVKGGMCCSGMFDLKPVRLSARSSYVRFTDEMEQALSPQRHLDRINAPLIVAYGTLETPEFQRQSRDFAAALAAAGKPVQLLVASGVNHFEVIESLAQADGLLGAAVLAQMGLRPGPLD
jgi:arylformamidase